MSLFGISRELKFRVCKCGEPCASSHMARERIFFFYREEKEVGRTIINTVEGFSLSKEEYLFFLLGSTIITGHEHFLFSSPNSI